MSLSIEEYQQIEKRVQAAQQQRDEARGRRQQLMQELKDKYGCDTITEAREKLKDLEQKEQELQDELEEKKKQFQKDWKDVLDESE